MDIFRLIPLFLLLLSSCKEPPIPVPPPRPDPNAEPGVVAVYRTLSDGSLSLALSPDSLPLGSPKQQGVFVTLNPALQFQEMEGFGAALTGSSAYVLMEHLSASERQATLRDLFSPEDGIGISYLRITVGASDFSLANYTYNDLTPGQTDPAMQSFSLARDEQHLIPLLKEILAIAPDLRIMATPWSAPAWMKSNQSLLGGGSLNPGSYEAFARYLTTYLGEMKQQGIEIDALTVQNEPQHSAPYPSMLMTAGEQKIFIRDHLGPMLEQAGIRTKLILYDHNWDNPDYPLEILGDPVAKDFVAGTAFHCYAGEVRSMSEVREAHPDKGIYFTECSGGDWSPDFGTNLAWNIDNLFVGATRHWAKTVLLWNLALDENHGPRNGGCPDCRGVITVNSANGAVTNNVEYVLLGHTARFVRPGAHRISTPDTRSQGISQVAFQNTDQSFVMVAYNHLDRPVTMEVAVNQDQTFVYQLSAGMLVTFVWEAE